MDEEGLNPEGELCARCGRVAAGFAKINDDRLCHPDDPNRDDCYELQSHENSRAWFSSLWMKDLM